MPRAKRSNLFIFSVFGFVSFLIAFTISYALHSPLPSSDRPLLFYSTHLRDDLRLTTLQAIKRATKSIFLYTYALTDPSILSLLKKKAKEGVEIHITYHKANTPLLHRQEEEHLHFYPTHERGLMHEKLLVIDHAIVFFSTANMTYSSLMVHDNFSLGIYSKDLARYLLDEKKPLSPSRWEIRGQTVELHLLPDFQKKSLKRLLETLDCAQKKLNLSLFTITHPEITQKLIQLHQRGVQINLFIDHYSARGAALHTLQTLQEHKITPRLSRGLQLFHHKWALIDDQILILGSANWTKAAFEKNREYLLFLSPLTPCQIKILNKTINIIKHESVNLN